MTSETTAKPRTGYEGRPITKPPDWHGLVAWDMLFNGLTTGLYLTAALGELILPDIFTRMARIAYPLALVFLNADLLCLVLDLGDPLRFHHMLRIFKPTSPMSLGTWCLTIYSFPLTVAAALSLLPNDSPVVEGIRKTAVILGVLPALGSAVYKGVLLSTTAQPGWRDARWLGCYHSSSAILLGCAEMLALAIFMGQERAVDILRPALLLLILFNYLPLGLLFTNFQAELFRIYRERKVLGMEALYVIGGTMIPLVLLIVARSSLAILAAVLILLAGNLMIRFVIVRLPHDATHRT